MTEQERYTYKKWYGEFQILDYDKGFAVIDTDTQAKIICKELNKLHEENIKLKTANQRWEKICCEGLQINNNLRKKNNQNEELDEYGKSL